MKKIPLFAFMAILVGILGSSFGIPNLQNQAGFPINTAKAETNVTPVEKPLSFTDISETTAGAEAIASLKKSGIIQGYADGKFQPTREMNRAEFVKVLIGSITDKPAGKNCFDDVRDEWFAPYICEAKKRGIVEGVGTDGKLFKPADPIKFSEAAKVVVNTYKLNKDQADSEVWYKNFITALEKAKAIPMSVEYFDANVNRAAMAETIWRLKEKVTDKASRTYNEINGEGLIAATSCADIQNRLVTPQNNWGMDGIMLNSAPGNAMVRDAIVAPTTEPAAVPMTNQQEKSVAAPAMEIKTGGGGSGDYSTTNIQVEGVDEADIIKNDGKYIYLIKGSTVRIIEAYPSTNLKELISFSFAEKDSKETFTPSEMYVDGNNLTVIGYAYKPYETSTTKSSETGTAGSSMKMMAPSSITPYYNNNRVKVYILDITDHSKPKVQRSVEYDANYTSSRKIGNTLYMVMQKSPFFYPYYTMERRNADIKPADFLPQMLDSAVGKDEFMAPCNKILILPKPRDPNFLITSAVPLADKTAAIKNSIVVGNAENVYASTKNLYVAATNWQGGFYRPYEQTSKTAVYKFALNNNGIEYQEQGKVPGQILNQFSMDENNGYFRIATTTNNYGNNSANHLYVLDSGMKQVGKIEGIAPGESIYSVRFLGNRAYMVTFKQVDPLFVIDLSKPTDPKILGKLKIPGYSNYLHPYDENHLMGFGKEVDESIDADKVHSDNAVYYTAVQGMKIGMFDVTDVSHPKEMFKEVIGNYGTYSELLNNHKALLFDKEKKLLAFPVSVNEIKNNLTCSDKTYSTCSTPCQKVCVSTSCTYDNGVKVCKPDCDGVNSCVAPSPIEDSKLAFVGAYVYNVDLTNGFKLRGKVTHLNTEDMAKITKDGYLSDYQKTIERVLYIGDTLYTVSKAMVKANDLQTITEKTSTTLAGGEDVYFGKPMPLMME